MAPPKKTKKAVQDPVTKRPGRPATGRINTQILRVRVSPEERYALEAEAGAEGLTMHAYLRQRLGLSHRGAAE